MNRTPPNTPTRVVSLSRPVTNRVDVKKLLLSKWTAVKPIDKCKHFLVVQVIAPEPPNLKVQWVELEAVLSHGVSACAGMRCATAHSGATVGSDERVLSTDSETGLTNGWAGGRHICTPSHCWPHQQWPSALMRQVQIGRAHV